MNNLLQRSFSSGLKPLGVPLGIHWSAILLPFLFIFQYGLIGIPLYLILLASLLFHEYSHVFAAQKRGHYVGGVSVLAIGASAMINMKGFVNPKDELIIAAAGPIGSFILALILLPIYFVYSNITLIMFAYTINVVLFLFNLLPLYPMDGGRILNSLLGFIFKQKTALEISVIFSNILSLIGAGICLYYKQYWVAMILGIIFLFARQQRSAIIKNIKESESV